MLAFSRIEASRRPRATNPKPPGCSVPETHLTTTPGTSEEALIHSDIVFFETPGGGAVFSVGSITFCGALLTNGGDNDVARVMRNVLERFGDEAVKFEMP